MTETITIPLNKLLAWEGNVRKTDVDKGVDELVSSIAAQRLLQSLVVRKDRRGKFAVFAGQRRLLLSNPSPKPGPSRRTGPFRANIAEGFRRRGRGDKVRFLSFAEGSVEECRYFLILAKDLGYGDTQKLSIALEEVSRLLHAYGTAILASSTPGS